MNAAIRLALERRIHAAGWHGRRNLSCARAFSYACFLVELSERFGKYPKLDGSNPKNGSSRVLLRIARRDDFDRVLARIPKRFRQIR